MIDALDAVAWGEGEEEQEQESDGRRGEGGGIRMQDSGRRTQAQDFESPKVKIHRVKPRE